MIPHAFSSCVLYELALVKFAAPLPIDCVLSSSVGYTGPLAFGLRKLSTYFLIAHFGQSVWWKSSVNYSSQAAARSSSGPPFNPSSVRVHGSAPWLPLPACLFSVLV